MSILKFKDAGKKSVDPQLRDDPFELFTLENYEPPRPQASRMQPRLADQSRSLASTINGDSPNYPSNGPSGSIRAVSHANSGWRKWMTVVACASIAASAAFITFKFVKVDSTELVKPYAYFEVRVIDGNGHPVAGAQVRNGGRKIGTTDSFGEWRRYMKVTLGSTVSLGFTKKTSADNFASIKNFAVPVELPKEGDLGIKGTVQILREAEFLSVNNIRDVKGLRASKDQENDSTKEMGKDAENSTGKKLAADASKTQAKGSSAADAVATAADEVVSDAAPALSSDAADASNTAPSSSQQASGLAKEAARDSGSESAISDNALGSITVVTDPQSVDSKKTAEVAEAMRQRAKELGLNVTTDARWRVTLQGIQARQSDATASGLFIVRTEIKGVSNSKAAFMRNFEKDSRISARGALWILSMHVQKDFNVGGRDGAWTVSDRGQTKGLFSLAPGKTLVSSGGRMFSVSNEAIMVGANKSYVLSPPDIKPCENSANSCSVYSQSIVSTPPVANWKRLQLKAVALQKPDTEVFVSGYSATPTGRGVWEFWGAPGTAANVTVMIEGKLAHRTKVSLKDGIPAILAVPAMGVSRR